MLNHSLQHYTILTFEFTHHSFLRYRMQTIIALDYKQLLNTNSSCYQFRKKTNILSSSQQKLGTSCFIRALQNCRHIHLSTFKKKQKNKKTILKLTTKFPRALFIDTLWFHKILYFLQSPPLDSVQNFNFWLHIQTNVQPYQNYLPIF